MTVGYLSDRAHVAVWTAAVLARKRSGATKTGPAMICVT